MFTCPQCAKPHNMYAKQCESCGAQLPAYQPQPEATPPPAACRNCGHHRFAVVSPVQTYDNYRDLVHPLPVVAAPQDTGSPLRAGDFRVHVCLGCGLTEWFARAPAALESLAQRTGAVRIIEAPPRQPYR